MKNTATAYSNQRKSNSKPVLIFAAILLVLLALLFVVNNLSKDTVYGKSASELNPATKEILNDENYQNILLPDELDQLKADHKNFFVYFFSSSCPHCRYTTPYLTPLVKELGVDMKQFNLLEFKSYFGSENIEYTPTLVYFENGVQKDRLVGGVKEPGTESGHSVQDFKAFFEKYKANVNAPVKEAASS